MSKRRILDARKRLAGSVVFLAGSASALTLDGDNAAKVMTSKVLASCSGTSSIAFLATDSDTAEQALLAGSQEVAPMTRFLGAGRTCQSAHPERSGGLLAAHAAVVVAAGTSSSSGCPGGVSSGGSIAVTEQNGVSGLQCPGCAGTSYSFADWRDVLRVLLTGMHHDAGSDLTRQDCNSDVRYTLANGWASFFQGGCSSGACTQIRHVFRCDDLASATPTFLELLGLPSGATARPFCNGSDIEDSDPIRRSCDGNFAEQVCSGSGTLGLVVPVTEPEQAPGSVAFNATPCSRGVFAFLPAPVRHGQFCPDGQASSFGKCLTPLDAAGNAGCLNLILRNVPFGAPPTLDPRVYNVILRKANGTIVRDAQNREMEGAYYRLHTSAFLPGGSATCIQPNGGKQAGCLTQANPCSLGASDFGALGLSGVSGLSIGGVPPTVDNVRKLQLAPVPTDVYPAAMNVFLNTMAGPQNVSEAAQSALFGCFSNRTTVDAAATAAGFVTLNRDPVCTDFDERQCGSDLNVTACPKPIDFCPAIAGYTAAPLQAAIGGQISLSASANDPDDPASIIQFVWSATTGQFADRHSATTTYTCTAVGAQVITLHVFDGECGDSTTIDVTCVAP